MVLPSSFCPSSRLSVFDYKNVSSDVQSLLLEALTGRSSHQRCSMSKVVLRNFTGFTGNTRQSFFFNKEILWQVFSCGFCEISKNTFLTEQLWTTACMRALNSFYIFRSDDRIYILLQYDCFPNLWENVFIIFVRKM